MNYIHFASLNNLWCFLLCALVAALLSLRYNKKRKAQELLVGTHFEFLRNHSAQKQLIKSLVKKLSCERVGLILFSGSAFVQCPLTTDYGAFFLYLDAVDAELISSGTTALDQAIQQALTSFSSVADRKSKLLVMFTDGE